MKVFNKIIDAEPAAYDSGLKFKFNATDQVLRLEECGYATMPVPIQSQVVLPIRVR